MSVVHCRLCKDVAAISDCMALNGRAIQLRTRFENSLIRRTQVVNCTGSDSS